MFTATLTRPATSAPATSTSYKLCHKHQREWERDSGVDREITKRNVFTLTDNEEIAGFIGWKKYFHTPGWGCTGIDPWTGQKRKIGQFKPDTPIKLPDAPKPAKYLTHKTELYTPIFLDTGDPEYWLRVAEDIGIDIFTPEGGKKAGVLLTHGYAAIGLCGVWMFQEDKKLLPDLKRIKWAGRKVYIPFDADIDEKKGVQEAALLLGQLLQKEGADVYMILWNKELGKGVDDLIVQHNIVAFNRAKEQAVHFDDWIPSDADIAKKKAKASKSDDKPSKQTPPLHKASDLLQQYKGNLLWREDIQSWYKYQFKKDGVWSPYPFNVLKANIADNLKADDRFAEGYSQNYLKEVIGHLQDALIVTEWEEAKRQKYIPFIDGVWDITKKTLLPHDPNYRFTSSLPYNVSDFSKGCSHTLKWMKEAMGGHDDRVQGLRAFLKATLTGRYDLQFFVELYGPAGSGKSTFGKIPQAMVGRENVFVSDLRQLEKSTFEVAGAVGKMLAVFPETNRYGGSVEKLKAMTGADELKYEQKYQLTGNSFTYQGTTLMMGNIPIQFDDPSSAIARRRISIPFNNVVAPMERERLLDFEDGKPVGKLAPEIPALIKWALDMSDTDMVNCLKNTSVAIPSLSAEVVKTKCDSDPLIAWLEDNCVYMANGAREKVGDKRIIMSDDGIRQYKGQDTELYPNYCHWCEVNGKIPLNSQLFSNAIVDKCNNELNLKKVRRTRDSNRRYIAHIILKGGNDHLPGVASYGLLHQNDGLMTGNDSPMTAETLDNAEHDGDDGVFEKSLEEPTKNDFEESPPLEQPATPLVEESFSPSPSSPSSPAPEPVSADTTSDTDPAQPETADSNELKEGDTVRWQNAPSYLGVYTRFVVMAVMGKFACLKGWEGKVQLCELVKV